MTFIRQRGKTFFVIYRVKDDDGTEHQRSETFPTQKDANRRLKEIEYKKAVGKFVVPKCTVVKELIEEYVRIYGHDKFTPIAELLLDRLKQDFTKDSLE